MKDAWRRMYWPWIAVMLLIAGCASAPRRVAEGVLNRWDPPSAAMGRRLIAEYGLPDDVTLERLTWNRRGEWKRTIVWNAAGLWHRHPVYRTPEDFAVMQQTIDYPMDLAEAAKLTAFSDGLVIDPTRGELSSRAGSEKLDYLTLNLADEIVRGAKTVPQAQVAYARLVDLTAAGKSSPYTSELLFASGR
ncbi:MAG: hypothetical protein HKL90_00340 [Elusimicrobia bacterium]|nr:hypothetical protein [Elusimicrobiota bacterium]